VETVLSPRSIDDVRLFTVRDLDDIPDLYDFARPGTETQNRFDAPCRDHDDAPCETSSLEFTQGTVSVEAAPRSVDEAISFADASSTGGEELAGLSLLEQQFQQQPQQGAEEEPAIILNLDFLKQDPPKAHFKRSRFA